MPLCCHKPSNIIKTTSQGFCADEMSRVIFMCGVCFRIVTNENGPERRRKPAAPLYIPRKFKIDAT